MWELLWGYKPVWKHVVRHVEWDVNWLHKTKWDVLEARWYSRTNSARIKELIDSGEVTVEVLYGKKVYLDRPMLKRWYENLKRNN